MIWRIPEKIKKQFMRLSLEKETRLTNSKKQDIQSKIALVDPERVKQEKWPNQTYIVIFFFMFITNMIAWNAMNTRCSFQS